MRYENVHHGRAYWENNIVITNTAPFIELLLKDQCRVLCHKYSFSKIFPVAS